MRDRRRICLPMDPAGNNRVIKGGIFNVAKAQYSPETRKIVNELIQESRLTLQLRRRVKEALESGQPLQGAEARAVAVTPRPAPPLPTAQKLQLLPPRVARRPLQAIELSGAYERERFRPRAPRVDREKERTRLQNIMTYGKSDPPPEKKLPESKDKKKETLVSTPNDDEIIDHLMEEIDERMKFLDEMSQLGEEKKYHQIIVTEIAQKLRQIEKIDKNRSLNITENVNKQLKSSS